MTLDQLTASECDQVHACLRATVDGPFFEDGEFQTLFGLTRDEVRVVADNWPPAAPFTKTVQLAIVNSLVNLLGYPHGQSAELRRRWGVTSEQLQHLMNRMETDDSSGA